MCPISSFTITRVYQSNLIHITNYKAFTQHLKRGLFTHRLVQSNPPCIGYYNLLVYYTLFLLLGMSKIMYTIIIYDLCTHIYIFTIVIINDRAWMNTVQWSRQVHNT